MIEHSNCKIGWRIIKAYDVLSDINTFDITMMSINLSCSFCTWRAFYNNNAFTMAAVIKQTCNTVPRS